MDGVGQPAGDGGWNAWVDVRELLGRSDLMKGCRAPLVQYLTESGIDFDASIAAAPAATQPARTPPTRITPVRTPPTRITPVRTPTAATSAAAAAVAVTVAAAQIERGLAAQPGAIRPVT